MIAATRLSILVLSLLPVALAPACGGGSEADRLGVGAQCTSNDHCDDETDQVCLPQFKGGYCGIQGCEADEECPEGSACVEHEDSQTYCFRICVDKPDCNRNRDVEVESNCSASTIFIEGAQGRKACIPPSAGS
jgi:hypothetical protein